MSFTAGTADRSGVSRATCLLVMTRLLGVWHWGAGLLEGEQHRSRRVPAGTWALFSSLTLMCCVALVNSLHLCFLFLALLCCVLPWKGFVHGEVAYWSVQESP